MAARDLVTSGIRPGTRLTYNSAQKRYLQFCDNYNLCPIPATNDTILLYITHLHSSKLAPASISVYLAAVRSAHVMAGFPEPYIRTPQVKLALKSIYEQYGPPNQKSIIDFHMFSNMYSLIQQDLQSELWSAIMTLAFFAGLRGS